MHGLCWWTTKMENGLNKMKSLKREWWLDCIQAQGSNSRKYHQLRLNPPGGNKGSLLAKLKPDWSPWLDGSISLSSSHQYVSRSLIAFSYISLLSWFYRLSIFSIPRNPLSSEYTSWNLQSYLDYSLLSQQSKYYLDPLNRPRPFFGSGKPRKSHNGFMQP